MTFNKLHTFTKDVITQVSVYISVWGRWKQVHPCIVHSEPAGGRDGIGKGSEKERIEMTSMYNGTIMNPLLT